MLGAAGCIAPEVLASAGAIPQATEDVVWFRSGVIPPAGTYETGYWTDPYSLFFVEIILMQFAELKRLQDYRFPGSQGKQYFLGLEAAFNGSGNPAYPGLLLLLLKLDSWNQHVCCTRWPILQPV